VSATPDFIGTEATCPGCQQAFIVPNFAEHLPSPKKPDVKISQPNGRQPAPAAPKAAVSGNRVAMPKPAAAAGPAPGVAPRTLPARQPAAAGGGHRFRLETSRLSSRECARFFACLGGQTSPRPLWSVPAPVDESWKLLLPAGLAALLGMALIGGDSPSGWPWIAGWFLGAALLIAGMVGWIRSSRHAARLGFPAGAYLFASDLIDARDGVCTLYSFEQLQEMRARPTRGGDNTESEVDFVFPREVVSIRMPGRQTAQITVDKFWPAREKLLVNLASGEWAQAAAADPLYEARGSASWAQACQPQAAPALSAVTAIDTRSSAGFLGIPATVLCWGLIGGLLLAPGLWFTSNYSREALAFSHAQTRDSVAGWEEYLQRDQPAHYLAVRQTYLPQAALRAAKKEGTAEALRRFLAKYGDTTAAAQGQAALHDIYAQAMEQMKTAAPASSRDAIAALLRWLEAHRTNQVAIRFGSSSEFQMKALDDFIQYFTENRRLRTAIVPIGPSLSREVVNRHEEELVAQLKSGLATLLKPDLVELHKGGTFSGNATALDEPALTLSCVAEPVPEVVADLDSARIYLRLTFKEEFNLVVPGSRPYTLAFEVGFADKIPRARDQDNLYDGMMNYAFEEAEQRIAANLFPQHLPERKTELIPVTHVQRDPSRPVATATGFCISPDGYIATANHFVAAVSRYRIVTQEGPVEASLVVSDPARDLAILKVAHPFPAVLALRPSEKVKLGESIATIGFPQTQLQGREPKIGKGEVASLAGMRDDPTQFQVSVPVQPGNSGGPLLDLNGNVVGVVVGELLEAQAVNYAVKSQYLAELCRRIPALSSLSEPASGPPPPFEDVVDRVRQATVLIEGFR
jgi:S1-C subfamily serine protease